MAKSTGSSVAVGLGLVGTGAVLMFGGATGRLAAMLAALFYPGALVPATPGNSLPLFPAAPPGGGGRGGGGGGGDGTGAGGGGAVPEPPGLPSPAPSPPGLGSGAGGILGDLELIAGG